jgi:hypothetical protein
VAFFIASLAGYLFDYSQAFEKLGAATPLTVYSLFTAITV